MSKNYCFSALKPLNIYFFSNGLLIIKSSYYIKNGKYNTFTLFISKESEKIFITVNEEDMISIQKEMNLFDGFIVINNDYTFFISGKKIMNDFFINAKKTKKFTYNSNVSFNKYIYDPPSWSFLYFKGSILLTSSPSQLE